jgi:hypothetical protein
MSPVQTAALGRSPISVSNAVILFSKLQSSASSAAAYKLKKYLIAGSFPCFAITFFNCSCSTFCSIGNVIGISLKTQGYGEYAQENLFNRIII